MGEFHQHSYDQHRINYRLIGKNHGGKTEHQRRISCSNRHRQQNMLGAGELKVCGKEFSKKASKHKKKKDREENQRKYFGVGE